MTRLLKTTAAFAAVLAAALTAPAFAQTTHTVGSAGGMDFADLATAIASASVVAGDTLLLDPNNNANAMYAPANISKDVTILGQNNPQVGGANWVFSSSATIRNLTVTGGGFNGVVVNGDTTVVTIDGCTITGKERNGVNINGGTVNITGATVLSNNGWTAVSIGGGANPTVTITGTASTPIIISNNGNGDGVAEVTRAALSTRQLAGPATTSATWTIEHAEISGSPYGFVNQLGNVVDHTLTFQNVDITNVSSMAVLIRGDNTTMNYDGGTISGRVAADTNPLDNFELPLIYITEDSATNGNDFIASNLVFPAGNTPAKIRSESNPIEISDSVIHGGTDIYGFIYVGAGGATFTNCEFIPTGKAIMQAVGGTAPITLIDPVFGGDTGIPFYMQGHTGEFSIIGTDPANKVNLDAIANVAVFYRNWSGTATFTNVTSSTNGSLYDTFGFSAPLAGPVTLNINQSVFGGMGGRMIVFSGAPGPYAETVTVNLNNSIWLGDYTGGTEIITVNDPNRTTPATINMTHVTMKPTNSTPGSIVINAENGKDVVNAEYSITDASGVATLLASGAVLTGVGNLIYSTGGATASGGWINGSPVGTIIADPILAGNGELQAGSPAIDNAIGSTATVDYAGNVRPQGNAPDIGAHESAFTPVSDWLSF